jgi:hypothetical protein
MWVGTGRVVKVVDDSTNQQSSYLNPFQHLLESPRSTMKSLHTDYIVQLTP